MWQNLAHPRRTTARRDWACARETYGRNRELALIVRPRLARGFPAGLASPDGRGAFWWASSSHTACSPVRACRRTQTRNGSGDGLRAPAGAPVSATESSRANGEAVRRDPTHGP